MEAGARAIEDRGMSRTQGRSSNIELLRIVSMFLVLMIHYIPSRPVPTGETLVHDTLGTLFTLELRSICFVCVNCFILISGYFGIRWRLKSFANLLFRIFFWVIVCPLVMAVITGSFEVGELLHAFYNGSTRWFIEAYIGLYVIAPVLNSFIEKSTRRELGLFILAFYLFSTLWGYVGHAADFNRGMSVISLMGLYFIGAYLRENQEGVFARPAWFHLAVYLVTGFVMVGIAVAGLKAGISLSPHGYINPLIILESVALFLFFKQLNLGSIAWINSVAASAFAVYLIHSDSTINPYYKAACNYIEAHYSLSFLYALVFLVGVFVVSVLADKVRIVVYRLTVQRWLKL